MDRFSKFCKDTMIFRFLESTRLCQPLLSGGYGIIKALKVSKRGIRGLSTTDIDLHINVSNKQWASHSEVYMNIARGVADLYVDYARLDRSKVAYRAFNLPVEPVAVSGLLNVKVHKMLMVTYKGAELLDIAITTEPMGQLDPKVLKETGMPLKTIHAYRKEVYSMIVRETIPGVNNQAMRMRHPTVGKNPQKGKKDVLRMKRLCGKDRSGVCAIASR